MLQAHHASYNLPWPPLRCPSLEAQVTALVVSQVDFCHALVGLKGHGEGLQSSTLVGISLQLLHYALSSGSSACPAQTCIRDKIKIVDMSPT